MHQIGGCEILLETSHQILHERIDVCAAFDGRSDEVRLPYCRGEDRVAFNREVF